MFWKRKNTQIIGRYGKQLEKNIQVLYDKKLNVISPIFCVLAEKHDNSKLIAAKALCKILNTLSYDDIVCVDEQMRQSSSMEWFIDWRKYNINDFFTSEMNDFERRAISIFASFNPNGFIREKAVVIMQGCESTLPYIMLRLNDWVEQVRKTAHSALLYRLQNLSDGEIGAALPFADKLKRSRRSSQSEYADFFTALTINDLELRKGLENGNVRTRRICVEALFSVPNPNVQLAFERLTKESDPFLRAKIFRDINNLEQKIDGNINIFLNDKYPINRLLAFQYLLKTKANNVFEIAKKLLLDKSAIVREFAKNTIKELSPQFDFRKFYLSNLKQYTAVAISGLGENGILSDTAHIKNYLKDTQISVVKSAMVALMRLGSEYYCANIIELLDDSRVGVVKTACNLSIKMPLLNYERIKAIFYNTKFEHTRLKCADILFSAPKWVRLVYMLEMMTTKDKSIREKSLDAISCWLDSFNRSYALLPNEKQKNEIKNLIHKIKGILPTDIEKHLLFVLPQ